MYKFDKCERKKKIIITAIICFCIGFFINIDNFCSKADGKTGIDVSNIKNTYSTNIDTSKKRDTIIDVNNGKYTISRNIVEDTKQEQLKENDTVWTIFVYMCGSDYETKNGAASKDIQEMIKASTSTNVRVILQTGGSKKWSNNNIDSDKIQRFIISNGAMELIQEKPVRDEFGTIRSMGDTSEFYDFLAWGLTNFSSSHMGLIMWNHGGGSSDGICYDELADMESLKLGEIECALAHAKAYMNSRFEFVAFDACVSQNLETANLLVPYAKYMVGSETPELDKGFDYTSLLKEIDKNINIDTANLCKKICESSYNAYLKSVTGVITAGSVVFSTLDLEKVDAFLYEFNNVAKELSDTCTRDNYYKILNKIENSTRFGAGQIDINDMLVNIEDDIASAKSAANKLKELVIYTKKSTIGSWFKNPNGLSMYICSEYAQIQNYNNLIHVSVSPFILNYYESIIYGSKYGNLDKYNIEKVLWQQNDNYYCNDFSFVENIFENEVEFRNSHMDTIGDNAILNKWYSIIKENIGISLLDNASSNLCTNMPKKVENHISMTLNKDSIDKISNVEYKVYSKVYNELEGSHVYKELGTCTDAIYDRQTGYIQENFNNKWLKLPNGFKLAIIDSYTSENSVRMVSPCYVNDEYVYLYTTLDTKTNEVIVEGFASIYENLGIQTKMLEQLKIGDCVQPMFKYIKEPTNGIVSNELQMNYAFCDVDANFKIEYSELDADEDIYISILLEDVFNNKIYSELIKW